MGKGLAFVGLFLGIAALLLFWMPLIGWLLLFAGVIVGIIAMSTCRTTEEGRGLALTGFLLSMIAIILFLVVGISIQNYMGVFSKPLITGSPPKTATDGSSSTKPVCSFDKDFTCQVYFISPHGLNLMIYYQGTDPLNSTATKDSTDITVTGDCTDHQTVAFRQPGEGNSVGLCLNQLINGTQFKGQFTISYLVQGEQTPRITHGTITGKVE
jgi:hypothetical protein